MSIQEIKDSLATLPPEGQDEVAAFLFHLRHHANQNYVDDLSRRINDKESANWLTPEEFEQRLDEPTGT